MKAFNFFSAKKNDYLILLLSPQKLWIIYLKCFWQYRHWYFFFKLKSFSFMWVSLCFFRFLLPFNSNEQISHLIFRLSPNSCCSRRCTNKLAFLLKTYNKIFPKLIPILLITLVHAVTFHEKNSLSLLKKTLSQNLKLPSHICHRGIL